MKIRAGDEVKVYRYNPETKDITMIQAKLKGTLAECHTVHVIKCIEWWCNSWSCCIEFKVQHFEWDSIDFKVSAVMEKCIQYANYVVSHTLSFINPLNTELNPMCYLLALLGAHHFLHVSRIRVKSLTLRLLMSYIYIWSTYS